MKQIWRYRWIGIALSTNGNKDPTNRSRGKALVTQNTKYQELYRAKKSLQVKNATNGRGEKDSTVTMSKNPKYQELYWAKKSLQVKNATNGRGEKDSIVTMSKQT